VLSLGGAIAPDEPSQDLDSAGHQQRIDAASDSVIASPGMAEGRDPIDSPKPLRIAGARRDWHGRPHGDGTESEEGVATSDLDHWPRWCQAVFTAQHIRPRHDLAARP